MPLLGLEDLAVMSTKLIDAKKILDLGCGPSRVLAKCLLTVLILQGIGIDFSDSMINESKSYLKTLDLADRLNLKSRFIRFKGIS